MSIDGIWLGTSIVAVALAWAPAAAHLFERRAKLALDRDEYRVAQTLYRGWAGFGFAVAAALVATGGLAWTGRGHPWFVPSAIAFLALVGTQVVFWARTAPANRATENWTVLPDDWEAVRTRWEGSHALTAALDLVALIGLAWAAALMTGA